MKKSFLYLFLFFLPVSLFANIHLPKLISDGMILQRDAKVNVWGWADPAEKINVTIDNKTYSTITSQNGNWIIVLKPHKAGGSFNMVLSGNNQLEIKNILFGDVWLCSGQSNMELPMRRVKPLYEEEIRTANNPNIRTFIVPQKYNFKTTESDYAWGKWTDVNPVSVLDYSAVAYFFATELYTKYKIPIGIINASLGGSPIQAWMSEDALKAFPDYLNEAYKWRNDELIAQTEAADNKASNEWYAEANRKDAGHVDQLWNATNLNDSDWQTMNVPGYWNDKFPEIKNGVVWFRKEFVVSKADAGKPAVLNLGRIVDADSVFINGRFVGNVSYQYPPRWYNIPENMLVEGRNLITVRVVSNSGRGGFVLDKPYELKIGVSKIDLKGSWKLKQGCSMPPTPSTTFVRWKPMGLYNAMIAPLTNYAKKGIVWYQGESNTGNPEEYAHLLPALISNWREKFGQKNLAFLYAQLPNFMESKEQPSESGWAELRESQLKPLSMPNTGMAVTIDAGEWNDIHPLNKKTVGVRLAKLAQKMAYGDNKIVASAPVVKSVKVVDGKIVLTFSRSGNCLKTNNNTAPKCFAVAGVDGKFVWAKAEIKRNTIAVWNETIQKPVKVRYAWADNPADANLTDTEGNFVSPFASEVK